MSSNFPFIPSTMTQITETTVIEELPVFKELAYDFETGQFKTLGGQNYYVEKNEALKIWIYKALNKMSSRFIFNAYTANYGNELNGLIGRHLPNVVLESEIKRLITEAILVNPYITGVENFEFESKGSMVSVEFICITIYGNIEEKLEYLR